MKFRRNPRFEAQAKADPRYKAGLTEVAFDAAQHVRTVALGFRETGGFQRSVSNRGNVVYTDDPFAHLIEYGSARNPAYAPLRRGVRAAGLRLREEPKQ